MIADRLFMPDRREVAEVPMAKSAGGIFTDGPPKPAPTISILGQRHALAAGRSWACVRTFHLCLASLRVINQRCLTAKVSRAEVVGECRKPVDHNVGRGVGRGSAGPHSSGRRTKAV